MSVAPSVCKVPLVSVTVLLLGIVKPSKKNTAPVVVPAIVTPPHVPAVPRVPIVRLTTAPVAGLRLSKPLHVGEVPANSTVDVPLATVTVILADPESVPVYPVIFQLFTAAVASSILQFTDPEIATSSPAAGLCPNDQFPELE